jgi:tRNA(fMet)-specific endonuclease VapC
LSKAYLLDTNAVIARNNGDSTLLKLLRDADQVFISTIVLGELYFGAEKSGRLEANLRDVEKIALSGAILSIDIGVACIFGRVRYQQRRKGRPIPENDVWIAAVTIQHDLTLLTRDAHFNEVEGLQLESW